MHDDFNGLKWTGFLAESHLFAFKTLRIVYSMETNADNWLHHSFVANDASFGMFALSNVILFGLPISKSYFYFINHLWKHLFINVRNISDLIETGSHECATVIWIYRHLEKIKPNLPRASQICIGVIIDLSIKTHWLCDVLIGRELNEIMPTTIGRLDILWQTLGHRISGDLLIFCGVSQIWTPAVVFRCF